MQFAVGMQQRSDLLQPLSVFVYGIILWLKIIIKRAVTKSFAVI